jgi:hypothetical protein
MEHTFTQEHLLLYLYNELEHDLIAPLLHALETDNHLHEQFQVFKSELKSLDQVECPKPSATSVQIILEESSSELTANA